MEKHRQLVFIQVILITFISWENTEVMIVENERLIKTTKIKKIVIFMFPNVLDV